MRLTTRQLVHIIRESADDSVLSALASIKSDLKSVSDVLAGAREVASRDESGRRLVRGDVLKLARLISQASEIATNLEMKINHE